jgi:hypothetical protein
MSKGGARKKTEPFRVRSSSTTCVGALALSTECMARRVWVRGIATSSISQAARKGRRATHRGSRGCLPLALGSRLSALGDGARSEE